MMEKNWGILSILLLAVFCLIGCGKTKTEEIREEKPSTMGITELEVEEGTITAAVSPCNEYYVSPAGSDLNDGSREAPFRTLYYVKDVLCNVKDSVDGDITIYMGDGYYRLFQPLELTQENLNKKDGGSITFRAKEEETPVVSGGLQIKNWVETEVNGIRGIYKTQVAGLRHVRQFYAGTKEQKRAWTGAPVEWAWAKDRTGIKVYDIDLDKIEDICDVELLWPVEWKVFVMQCASYESNILYFEEPCWSEFTDMIDAMVAGGQSEAFYPNTGFPVYLSGDISFLDEPGEWFYDQDSGELYYYPDEDVDMEQTDFFIPCVENMLMIHGEETDKIKNLVLDGISFRHGAWNEPGETGLVINQAQNKMVITRSPVNGSVKVTYAQLDASITMENMDGLIIRNCTFENMGSTALALTTGIQNCTIEGCVFTETAEGGLVLSNFEASTVTEDTVCKGNIIQNNLFYRTGLDYWSAPALTVYYADSTMILHNDIYDVPYSGISLGWGWYWTPNSTTSRENIVCYNRIGKFMQKCRDGGGIYTLGQQPASSVEYNYIFDQAMAYGGLYHDEGSAYFTTTHNVIDNISFKDPNVNWIHVNGGEGGPNGGKTTYEIQVNHNYYSNKNTSLWGEPTTCIVEDNILVEAHNWPEEALKIMQEAGLESDYRHLRELYRTNEEEEKDAE